VTTDAPALLSAADVFLDGHTAYHFTDAPVSDEQLAAIYELARMAPTAMNASPLRVTYLRDEAKERLLPHLSEGNREKSASAPVVAILAYDVNFHEELPTLAPHNPNARENFAGKDEAARERFARFSASLQAGYFILASRTVGLDAGPMGGFDAARVDEEFLAGTSQRSILVVNLGIAAEDGTRPRAPRLDVATATRVLTE